MIPTAGNVYHVRTPMLLNESAVPGLVREDALFSFFCFVLRPTKESDVFEAHDVYILRSLQEGYHIKWFRQAMPPLRFRAASGIQIREEVMRPWLCCDEEEARAQLREEMEGPYADVIADFTRRILEGFSGPSGRPGASGVSGGEEAG